MKNGIADILNSMFSAPDKALLQKGSGSITPKGTQSNGSTFEDVLAQLASQDSNVSSSSDNQNQSLTASLNRPPAAQETPSTNGVSFESLTAVSELDITISERISVTGADQLAQAEQSLVNLAAGLSKLINLFSDIQSMDSSQAQAALVSFSNGMLSPDDAKSLLGELKDLASKFEGPRNPLALSSDQQNILLNQMLQQMIQNQQVLFGVLPNASTAASNGPSRGPQTGGNGSIQASEVFLQMSFSETQILSFQKTDNRSSSVFIDLQTFKMSATFIQEDFAVRPGQTANFDLQQSFRPLPASDSLTAALNQMFSSRLSLGVPETAPSAGQAASASVSSQDDLNRTFKNLVQMLLQSGASQAVLTSFLNPGNTQPTTDLRQVQAQIGSFGHLAENLASDLNLSSVLPNDSNFPVSINPIAAASTAPESPLVGQVIVQESTVQVQSLSVVVSENNSDQTSIPVSAQSVPTTASMPGIDTNVIKALNDVVARLSTFSPVNLASQTSASDPGKPTVTMDQLLGVLNAQPLPSMSETANSSEPMVIQTPAVQVPNSQTNTAEANPQAMTPPVMDNHSETIPASTVLMNAPSELNRIQASINELIAINQFIQTQSVINAQVPGASNPSRAAGTDQVNISVTRLAQIQLSQTVLLTGQGSPANEILAPAQVLNPPTVPDNSGTLTNENLAPKPSEIFVIPTLGSSAPSVSSVSSLPANTNLNPQAQVILSQPVQPEAPAVIAPNAPTVPAPPTSSAPVLASPAPVSDNSVNVSLPVQAGNRLVSEFVSAQTSVVSSAAQNVSSSVISGEAVKAVVQTPSSVQNNTDSTNQAAANSLPGVSGVQPVTSQAVVPVQDNNQVSVNLDSSNDLAKNTKNAADLLITPSLAANPNIITLTKSNDTPLASNQAAENKVNQKIDSFLILNQVQDQIRVRASEAKAVSRLDFQLIPESLGRVTVQIALVDQAVSARIIVSTQEVKDALQHHMIELKTSLNQAGLQIDQLQVQVQGGQSNLLAQYYQYQREGGYGSPASYAPAPEQVETIENTGVLGEMSVRMSLLDVLA